MLYDYCTLLIPVHLHTPLRTFACCACFSSIGTFNAISIFANILINVNSPRKRKTVWSAAELLFFFLIIAKKDSTTCKGSILKYLMLTKGVLSVFTALTSFVGASVAILGTLMSGFLY